ncbi:hypothetical protein ACH5RR_027630 [Cinchona calisaya]|uniref:Uncharacterized protein n=1 Tax=Cinchona calisaya TaxID=153742 RepID=A0ABD2Z716_9GENT
MGSCFSSSGTADSQKPHASANVITVAGHLRQYSIPVTVSQVLESLAVETTTTSSALPFFLCNSDCLYFDEYIPALGPHHQLQPAQIYFVLPLSKLPYKLIASDMAALAVKASLAIQTHNNNNDIIIPSRNKKARISPVLLPEQEDQQRPPPQHPSNNLNINSSNNKLMKHRHEQSRLSSSSRRMPKVAASRTRIRLTTISEGSLLL